jgi:hypothetical protein
VVLVRKRLARRRCATSAQQSGLPPRAGAEAAAGRGTKVPMRAGARD